MRQIHSSEDARFLARKRLPWMVFDYFGDAAGEGWGKRKIESRFNRYSYSQAF